MSDELLDDAMKKRNQKLHSYYFNNSTTNNNDIPSTFSKPVSKKNNRYSVVAEINPTSLPSVNLTSLDIDVSNLDSVITSDVNSLFNETWGDKDTLEFNFGTLNLNDIEDSKYNSDNSENKSNKELISLENTLADMIRKAYEQNSFILSSNGDFVCYSCKSDASVGCLDTCINKKIMRQMQDDLVYLKDLWESAEFMLSSNEMKENFKEFCQHYKDKSEKDLFKDFTEMKLIEKVRYNQDSIRLIEDNYIAAEPKYESDTLIGFSRLNQLKLKELTNRQAVALANAFKNTQPNNFSEEITANLEVIYEIIRIVCMLTSE